MRDVDCNAVPFEPEERASATHLETNEDQRDLDAWGLDIHERPTLIP